MQGSKPCALPLGDGPGQTAYGGFRSTPRVPRIKRKACRSPDRLPQGGYWDSNPRPPEPQSGALTSCAIPTIYIKGGPACGSSLISIVASSRSDLHRRHFPSPHVIYRLAVWAHESSLIKISIPIRNRRNRYRRKNIKRARRDSNPRPTA